MNRRRFLALFGIVAAKPELLIPPPSKYTPISQLSTPLPAIGQYRDYINIGNIHDPNALIGDTVSYNMMFAIATPPTATQRRCIQYFHNIAPERDVEG